MVESELGWFLLGIAWGLAFGIYTTSQFMSRRRRTTL